MQERDARKSSLMPRLDRRADVDGGKCGEDERLDGNNDHELEGVENQSDGDRKRNDDPECESGEDEQEADRDQNEHVAREHVRVETNAQADDAKDMRDRLE